MVHGVLQLQALTALCEEVPHCLESVSVVFDMSVHTIDDFATLHHIEKIPQQTPVTGRNQGEVMKKVIPHLQVQVDGRHCFGL